MLKTLTNNASKFALGLTVSVVALTPNFAVAQSNHNHQIQLLQQQKEIYQEQLENLETDLGFYIISNPKASAAVLASGVGFAGVLEENLSPAAKFTLAMIGLAGADYCLTPGNRQHCTQVGINLANYAIQLDKYEEEIDALTYLINRLAY